MRVLIGKNTNLDFINDAYVNIVSNVFNLTKNDAENMIMDNEINMKFRTSEKLQNFFIKHNMILSVRKTKTMEKIYKVSIITIPDNINFGISQPECTEGEQIVEEHRIWDSNGEHIKDY